MASCPFERACSQTKIDDGMFEYALHIVGEDGGEKKMQKNRMIFMKDVECYCIRVVCERMREDVGGYIPYAKVMIDGKEVAYFVLNEPVTEIDRFPSNGDALCFVACSTEDSASRRRNLQRMPHPTTPAFGNVTAENMGLIAVEFGVCRQILHVRGGNQQKAYYKIQNVDVPEPCKITSRDVEPLLEDFDLQQKKQPGGYDEPDCGVAQVRTVEGGTIRLGDQNTVEIAERAFTTCGVSDQLTTRSVTVRLVGTSPSLQQRFANRKNIHVKGIDGNILHSHRYQTSQLPPKADLTF